MRGFGRGGDEYVARRVAAHERARDNHLRAADTHERLARKHELLATTHALNKKRRSRLASARRPRSKASAPAVPRTVPELAQANGSSRALTARPRTWDLRFHRRVIRNLLPLSRPPRLLRHRRRRWTARVRARSTA
jgi:hypothetical protein